MEENNELEQELAFKELFVRKLDQISPEEMEGKTAEQVAVELFNRMQEELGSDVRFDRSKHVIEIGTDEIMILEKYMREKGEIPHEQEPQTRQTPEEEKQEPVQGEDGQTPAQEEDFDIEKYRDDVVEKAKRDIRLDQITIRMMEIRALLENPEAGLTTDQRMDLENERFSIQQEAETLEGSEHRNPSGPSLANAVLVEDANERAELNAERAKIRQQLERNIRMNEIRIRMIQLKREQDAQGITTLTEEQQALSREFDELLKESQLANEKVEIAQEDPSQDEPSRTPTGRTPGEGEDGGKDNSDEEIISPEGGKRSNPVQGDQQVIVTTIAEKQEKLDKINREIEEAGRELEELKGQIDVSREELEKLRAEIDSLTKQRDALKVEISDLEKRKAELDGKAGPTKGTGKDARDPEDEGVGAAGGASDQKEPDKEKDKEPEKEDDSESKKNRGLNVEVRGFWANLALTIINLVRRITGRDTFGAATEARIVDRATKQALGPAVAKNREDLKKLKKEVKREARAEAKEEGKKKGIFARLFGRDEEEPEEIEPEEEVISPEGGKTNGEIDHDPSEEAREVPEEVSLAKHDFIFIGTKIRALKDPLKADPIFKKLADEKKAEVRALSDKDIDEAIRSGEVQEYNDACEPRTNVWIARISRHIRELAAERGIELEDEHGVRTLDSIYPELQGRLIVQENVQQMMAEQDGKAPEENGDEGR